LTAALYVKEMPAGKVIDYSFLDVNKMEGKGPYNLNVICTRSGSMFPQPTALPFSIFGNGMFGA